MPDFQKILQNPVMLASSLLLLLAGTLVAASLGILVSAILYAPQTEVAVFAERSATAVNSSAIGERNFFGLAAAEPDIDPMQNLPETPLALVLKGAFASNQQNESSGAIIEDKEARITNHYRVGETLPGDAVLKAIYADRVVLTRNGLLETLYFPDIADQAGIGQQKTSSTDANRGALSPSDEAAKKRRDAIRDRIKQLRRKK